jgi:hypothetical protein
VIEFDSVPTTLGKFVNLCDTVGTLAPTTARRLLASRGHIIDIVPSGAKFLKSTLPGPYTVLITQLNVEDL